MKKRYISVVLFFILTIVIAVLSILLMDNGFEIRSVSEKRTSSYLGEVSDQIASNIDGRISDSVQMLRMIRDSAVIFPEDRVESFLERKKAFSEYDMLKLVPDGEAAQEWLEEAYGNIELNQEALNRGEPQLVTVSEKIRWSIACRTAATRALR